MPIVIPSLLRQFLPSLENLEDVISRQFRIPSIQDITTAAAVPPAEAIPTAVIGAAAAAGLAAPAIALAGFISFVEFIFEEAIQQANFAVRTALNAGNFELARRSLTLFNKITDELQKFIDTAGQLNPVSKGAFQAIVDSSRAQSEGYTAQLGDSGFNSAPGVLAPVDIIREFLRSADPITLPDIPQEFTGIVTAVIDGDTILVDSDKLIRLVGIDTPEIRKKGSTEATDFTTLALSGRPVTVRVDPNSQRDKFNRILGVVFIGDTNFNLELLRRGFARPFFKEANQFLSTDEMREAAGFDTGIEPAFPGQIERQFHGTILAPTAKEAKEEAARRLGVSTDEITIDRFTGGVEEYTIFTLKPIEKLPEPTLAIQIPEPVLTTAALQRLNILIDNITIDGGVKLPVNKQIGEISTIVVGFTNTGSASAKAFVGVSLKAPDGQFIDLPIQERDIEAGVTLDLSFATLPLQLSGYYDVIAAVWSRSPQPGDQPISRLQAVGAIIVGPPTVEETLKFWIDKGFTENEADFLAIFVTTNQRVPTDSEVIQLLINAGLREPTIALIASAKIELILVDGQRQTLVPF